MRVAGCYAAIILLAACENEESFDERYANTAELIENEARTIDRGLEKHSEGDQSKEPGNAHTNGSSNPHD